MKEGGVRKTWKKRFFVVRWDHTVDYFENEAVSITIWAFFLLCRQEAKKPKGKVKGSMGLAGYRVVEDVNEGLLKRATELAEKMGSFCNVFQLTQTFQASTPPRFPSQKSTPSSLLNSTTGEEDATTSSAKMRRRFIAFANIVTDCREKNG
jgi:hypothetical protein